VNTAFGSIRIPEQHCQQLREIIRPTLDGQSVTPDELARRVAIEREHDRNAKLASRCDVLKALAAEHGNRCPCCGAPSGGRVVCPCCGSPPWVPRQKRKSS